MQQSRPSAKPFGKIIGRVPASPARAIIARFCSFGCPRRGGKGREGEGSNFYGGGGGGSARPTVMGFERKVGLFENVRDEFRGSVISGELL